MGLPVGTVFLCLVVDAHTDVLVLLGVGRGHALLHRRGVDKELERRTRLAHGLHLVILPRLEVNVAHIGSHISRLRLHCHKTGVHELNHVLQRIDARHRLVHRAVVAKQLNVVRLVEVVVYRVLVLRETSLQHLIGVSLLYLVLNKARNDIALFVAPRITHATPMRIEVSLHVLHLAMHGLLGILLHLRVEGSVYLQAVRIDVQVGELLLHVVFERLAEIESLTVVGILHRKVQLDRRLLQAFERCFVSHIHIAKALLEHIAVRIHLAEHGVTTFQRVFGIDTRVVGRSSFEQAHQNGCLLGIEFGRRFVEVSARGCLYAESIRTEVDGVGILFKDFLFVAKEFNESGNDYLLALHDNDTQTGDFTEKARGILCTYAEHVLDKLLRDGRCTAGVTQRSVLGSREHTFVINAVVLEEAFVLRSDESLEESGTDRIVGNGRAVLVEILAQQHAVGTVNLRSRYGLGVNDFADGRRLAEEPEEVEIHGKPVNDDESKERPHGRDELVPPSPSLVLAFIPSPRLDKGAAYGADYLAKLAKPSAFILIC